MISFKKRAEQASGDLIHAPGRSTAIANVVQPVFASLSYFSTPHQADHALLQAVLFNKVADVKHLLFCTSVSKDGREVAIRQALYNGNAECFYYLVKSKSVVFSTCFFEECILRAISLEKLDLLKLLLERPELAQNHLEMGIFRGTQWGYLDAVRMLVEFSSPPKAIREIALGEACRSSQLPLIDYFLKDLLKEGIGFFLARNAITERNPTVLNFILIKLMISNREFRILLGIAATQKKSLSILFILLNSRMISIEDITFTLESAKKAAIAENIPFLEQWNKSLEEKSLFKCS